MDNKAGGLREKHEKYIIQCVLLPEKCGFILCSTVSFSGCFRWCQGDGPVEESVPVVSGRSVGVGTGPVPDTHEHTPKSHN